jgi:hypothetical protein
MNRLGRTEPVATTHPLSRPVSMQGDATAAELRILSGSDRRPWNESEIRYGNVAVVSSVTDSGGHWLRDGVRVGGLGAESVTDIQGIVDTILTMPTQRGRISSGIEQES